MKSDKIKTKEFTLNDSLELLDCIEEALVNLNAIKLQGFKFHPKNKVIQRLASVIKKHKGETVLTEGL